MKTLPTFIFDLDGVITNTEDYHFDAWKSICIKLNYDLSPEKNEEFKGVSRSECLEKITECSAQFRSRITKWLTIFVITQISLLCIFPPSNDSWTKCRNINTLNEQQMGGQGLNKK